jgi:hypothetical protein
MSAKKKMVIGVRQVDGDVRDLKTGNPVSLSEADRLSGTLAAIRAAATPPWQCGDMIPVAPARHGLERFTPAELVPDGQGGAKPELTGYRGRSGARVRDVFDKMVDQTRKAHAAKGDKAGVFTPPFTWGQVQMGRDYTALSERCAASGVKCSSLESLSRSGSGGGREEAVFDDLARLRALHRRIGDGLAKQLCRHRPSTSSAGATPRKSITARYLVDQVCLSGRTSTEILRAAGWTINARIRRDLRTELCAALDRMQGYQPDKPQNMD